MLGPLINDINKILMWFWDVFLADFHSGPIHEKAGNLKDSQARG